MFRHMTQSHCTIYLVSTSSHHSLYRRNKDSKEHKRIDHRANEERRRQKVQAARPFVQCNKEKSVPNGRCQRSNPIHRRPRSTTTRLCSSLCTAASFSSWAFFDCGRIEGKRIRWTGAFIWIGRVKFGLVMDRSCVCVWRK